MSMWRWRNIRPANILKDHRDLFERYGEMVVGLVLAGGYNPAAEDLRGLYSSDELKKSAGDWLQERGDAHERRENRLETIEVAILLFLILSVLLELIAIILPAAE
jgi:hypothetical protein